MGAPGWAASSSAYRSDIPGTGSRACSCTTSVWYAASSGRGRSVRSTVSSMSLTMPKSTSSSTTSTRAVDGGGGGRLDRHLVPAGRQAGVREPRVEVARPVGDGAMPLTGDGHGHRDVDRLDGEEVAPAAAHQGRVAVRRAGAGGCVEDPREDPDETGSAVPHVRKDDVSPTPPAQCLREHGVPAVLHHAREVRSLAPGLAHRVTGAAPGSRRPAASAPRTRRTPGAARSRGPDRGNGWPPPRPRGRPGGTRGARPRRAAGRAPR